jgi:hypothetical protein
MVDLYVLANTPSLDALVRIPPISRCTWGLNHNSELLAQYYNATQNPFTNIMVSPCKHLMSK